MFALSDKVTYCREGRSHLDVSNLIKIDGLTAAKRNSSLSRFSSNPALPKAICSQACDLVHGKV